MVTHDARAAAIADRILFLADGLHRQGARHAPTRTTILETIEEVSRR